MFFHRKLPVLASRPHDARLDGFWPLWLAAVLVPLLLFAVGSWWAHRTVEAETRARLARTVDMLREHALRALETQDALLTAAQRHTEAMDWEEIAASPKVAAFLLDLAGSAAWVSALGMVAPDGRLVQISRASFPPPPTDLAARDYVRAHQGDAVDPDRRFVGEAIIARVGGRLVVPVSRARLDAEGLPDGGVLWATFRPADFAAFFGSVAEGPNDIVALVRDDCAVLARYPLPDPPLNLAQLPAAGSVAFAGGVCALDPDEPRIFAARRLSEYPVSIVYGLHRSVPYRAWLRHSMAMGGIAAAAAGLLLWLTWLVQGRARREQEALALARAAAERRAEAEAALRDSQRLELLGQLAAGVAHDFRNVVQAVQGGAHVIGRRAEQPERVRDLARLIDEAAGRGGALTQRMLDFARRGAAGAERAAPLDPAAALAGTAELLGTTLGAGIRIRYAIGKPPPPMVVADVAELEAAVMNLAVNARDAMPEGGEVAIEVAGETVAPAERHPAGLPPGAYARIRVRDTGTGMDAETLARASEPFFTTKPPGKGTGLGLATARACAEGAGGALRIESTPGRGTTVTLWLPAAPPGAGDR